MQKLKDGTIDFRDMTNLLKRLGWELRGQKGSHQSWKKGSMRYTLTVNFPKYQLKEIRELILGDIDEKN
jgi:predicted RNA binding protein YcfA (HicA-like mRNA interferase family)